MRPCALPAELNTILLTARPQHLGAGAAPVLISSALGYAVGRSFNVGLFLLALWATVALHAGANMLNESFGHLSRNDRASDNLPLFSGGRRSTQGETLSPRAALRTGVGYLAFGVGVTLIILLLTKSLLILGIGLLGLLGTSLYPAKPIQLGRRSVGEVVIGLLSGVLPAYGSYYLQAQSAD